MGSATASPMVDAITDAMAVFPAPGGPVMPRMTGRCRSSSPSRRLVQEFIDLGGQPSDAFFLAGDAAAVVCSPLPAQPPHPRDGAVADARVRVHDRLREGFAALPVCGNQ